MKQGYVLRFLFSLVIIIAKVTKIVSLPFRFTLVILFQMVCTVPSSDPVKESWHDYHAENCFQHQNFVPIDEDNMHKRANVDTIHVLVTCTIGII